MQTVRLTLPKPHSAQQAVLGERKRWNTVACGRRWGKSILATNLLIESALPGRPSAYFCPTYKMLSDVWRHTKTLAFPVTAKRSEQEHRLELVGGGSIDMWSLDNPDSARGRKYVRALIDEAAMIANLEEAWNAVIRPTLTDYKGDGWMFSTPKGMNFFHSCYARGADPEQPDWACWQMPTTANPYIDPDEVESARQQLPERVFRQEYLAEFLEDAGGVFRGVRNAVDIGRTENEPHVEGSSYWLGVDLARVEDFTVLSVLDGAGRQVYHERFNQISWERQIDAIRNVAERYSAEIILDSTGVGDPIFEAVQKLGLHVTGVRITNTIKTEMIDGLAMGIEQGHLRLMDVETQTNELLAYQYELTPSRNVRMNAPVGMHDDCVIGLALAAIGWRESEYRGPVRLVDLDHIKIEYAEPDEQAEDELNTIWGDDGWA